jgi:hypothetical protein
MTALGLLAQQRVGRSVAYTWNMASMDHTVRLATRTYERLEAEARRRRSAVDDVADELLAERLPEPAPDLERARQALDQLAWIRARRGRGVDAVALVREGRDELDRRTLSPE